MENLADFHRGESAIKKAIASALRDNGVNESSVSSVTHGTEHIPDSVEMQIFANGHGVTESFTKIEVLDAATGVDQMAVSSRIRGIAARIAERFKL